MMRFSAARRLGVACIAFIFFFAGRVPLAAAEDASTSVGQAVAYGGFMYRGAMGDRFDVHSTVYPTYGFVLDTERFRFDAQIPAAIFMLDAIVSLPFILSDNFPVLRNALNGDETPGHFRWVSLAGTYRAYVSGPHALEIGAFGEVGELTGREGRFNVLDTIAPDLGLFAGYGYSTPDVSFRTHAKGGIGFVANPIVGAGADAYVRIVGPLCTFVAVDLVGRYQEAGDRREWLAETTTILGLGGRFSMESGGAR